MRAVFIAKLQDFYYCYESFTTLGLGMEPSVAIAKQPDNAFSLFLLVQHMA
jgi:hypothetical protein